MTWKKIHNKDVYPTLAEVEEGLISEAIVQLREAMWKVKDAQAHIEAKNNIIKTWKILLSKAQVPDRNEPLSLEIVHDPTHSVVGVINWCYTSEGFIYKILN